MEHVIPKLILSTNAHMASIQFVSYKANYLNKMRKTQYDIADMNLRCSVNESETKLISVFKLMLLLLLSDLLKISK